MRGELTRVLGPIDEVSGPLGMVDLVRKKRMFPSRLRRFCTTELKVKPLARYILGLGEDVINAVGIRAAESAARAKFTEWEWWDAVDAEVWRPLLRWSEEDVLEIHRRHGVAMNPLYMQGSERVGCWPCIHARKDEIRRLAAVDSVRIDEIRALEAEVQAVAAARHAAKGGTFESLGYMRPTFFQGRTSDASGGRGMWPIDDVVTWAKTSRGGRQLEMFSEPTDGCARWGMCDQAKGDTDEQTE